MTVRRVALHTIGQTPRPDLTERFSRRFPSIHFEVRGALDRVRTAEAVPAPVLGGYPLETRLRDGTSVVVDEAFLEPQMQNSIRELDATVDAHVVLCAGSFPGLESAVTLVRPFDVVLEHLASRAVRAIEVLVPFEAQSEPALRKWEQRGFSCRPHAIPKRAQAGDLRTWLAARLNGSSAEALVVDYVGTASDVMRDIKSASPLQVIDMDEFTIVALGASIERSGGVGR